EWDYRKPDLFTVPAKFASSFERYAFTEGLIVAPLKLTLAPGTAGAAAPLSIWNYLIFDRTRGVADRLDPHSAAKPELDAALGNFIGRTAPVAALTYRSPDRTGAAY